MMVQCLCGNTFESYADSFGVYYCTVCKTHREITDTGVQIVSVEDERRDRRNAVIDRWGSVENSPWGEGE